MAQGISARVLARLLSSVGVPFWIVGPSRTIVLASDEVGRWLGVDATSLVDRACVAGTSASDDPLDVLAAALSPPPFPEQHSSVELAVQPRVDGRSIAPLVIRFTRLGQGPAAITLAVPADASTRSRTSLHENVAVREALDAWRKQNASLAITVLAGTSASAKRTRARVQVASKVRTHVGFFGGPGCGSDIIAHRVHRLSAPGETIVVVDGPLMDAELLEASLASALGELSESRNSLASVMVHAIDEMPIEAQTRLCEVITQFEGRLRLLGLCSPTPHVTDAANAEASSLLSSQPSYRLVGKLADWLQTLEVHLRPLSERVEDIPLLASALLDSRHAAGDGVADRWSRPALDAMVLYPWPRNFAELDETIRHAVRTATSDVVGEEHLPLAVRSFRVQETQGPELQPFDLDEAMRRFELKAIRDAVEMAGGNRAEAARRLGISRARLLRRLDETTHEHHDSAEEADAS